MKEVREQQQQQGMYRPEFEHDNCGIGAVVNIKGKKTHDTVANALKIVEHLEHRAGKDAEGKTGDGVGILLQISHKFFKKACKKEGFEIGDEREYGIAQFFFPQHEIKRAQAKKMFEIILEKEGLELLGWRQVPVFPEVLGHQSQTAGDAPPVYSWNVIFRDCAGNEMLYLRGEMEFSGNDRQGRIQL